MSEAEVKSVAIEQAAVALLCEAKAAGVDLQAIAEAAKAGILGNKIYTFVGSPERKTQAIEQIDNLIGSTS